MDAPHYFFIGTLRARLSVNVFKILRIIVGVPDKYLVLEANRRGSRVRLRRYALILAAFGILLGDARASQTLQLIVSNETAPPGGTVQIKVFAATPTPIASGRLLLRSTRRSSAISRTSHSLARRAMPMEHPRFREPRSI